MKKLKKAYVDGAQGNPNRNNSGRLTNIAYKLGTRSFSFVEASEKAEMQATKQLLSEASKNATGINKQAMNVIEAASQIPHQQASVPGSVTRTKSPDGNSVAWHTALANGDGNDVSRHYTALLQPLGIFKVDTPNWSHNGLQFDVHNIIITCEALATDEDFPEYAGDPVDTIIWLNSENYDPNVVNEEKLGEYSGGVRLDINFAGEIVNIGLKKEGSSYEYESVDGVETNISELLQSLQSNAETTTAAFAFIANTAS